MMGKSGATKIEKEKLVHSNFRLRKDVLKELERLARQRNISTNALLNHILDNYLAADVYFEQLGFALVGKEFLRKAFSKIREEKDIEEFGRDLGLTIVRQYVRYFFPVVNGTTITRYLDLWLRRFGSYKHEIHESGHGRVKIHHFIVIHDVNMNFSKALKNIMEGMIVPAIKGDIKFLNITASAISFQFNVHE